MNFLIFMAFIILITTIISVIMVLKKLNDMRQQLLQQNESIFKQVNDISDQRKEIDNLIELYQQILIFNYMLLDSDLKNDFKSLENYPELDDKVKHLISRMKQNINETEKIRKKIF